MRDPGILWMGANIPLTGCFGAEERAWSSMKVTLVAMAVALRIGFALNPIHEASYNLVPEGNFQSATTLSGGVIIHSQQTSVYEMPLAIALKANPRVELGARFQTRWGDVDNNVPYMIFGVKALTIRHTSVQADLLVGTKFDAGKGFSISSYHKYQFTSWCFGRLASRLGFMDALVQEDALMAFEAAFYPTVTITRSVAVECGMIGSSQTKGFERYLAMDIQPALRVNFGRDSMIETAVALGLAGDRKEEMRVKVAINHGI